MFLIPVQEVTSYCTLSSFVSVVVHPASVLSYMIDALDNEAVPITAPLIIISISPDT